MGWMKDLAEKLIPEYNPKTDWWMRGGTEPHTPWQRVQNQEEPNHTHTPEPEPAQDDIDHEHDTVDHEHNTVIDKSDERQASIDAVPQAAIDHELAVMNEERDQRWAAQNRKAMDIPEPTTPPVWERAQAMASEPEAEAPAPSIDPA